MDAPFNWDSPPDEGIIPIDTETLWKHPFWHLCRKCATWIKIVIVSLAINALWDFATFEPIHRFYEWMGWIS